MTSGKNSSTAGMIRGETGMMRGVNFVPVICWQGSPEHDLPGFTPGHPMTVKVTGADGSLIAVTTTGTFGEEPYAEVTLDAASGRHALQPEHRRFW